MMTKEERIAAYKNHRIEVIDGRTYAVVTVDFGRSRRESHVQDMYQRLSAAGDTPRKLWHGTTLAADRRYEEREARLRQLREFRETQGR